LPLYEYRCKECGHQFEKIQSFSAPDEKECPVCKGELERLISAPAIQFKGAGWYVNDYAGKGGAKPAADSTGGSEKAAPSTDGGSKAATSESKSGSGNTGSPAGGGSTATTKSD
jgi:putative FmdB family regulatory protein